MEDPKRVQREHLVRSSATPVHDFHIGAGAAVRPPPVAVWMPGAVLPALGLDDVESLSRPGISDLSESRQDEESLENVVMPVSRVAQLEPLLLRPPGSVRSEQAVG
jgi:hypothetical protein